MADSDWISALARLASRGLPSDTALHAGSPFSGPFSRTERAEQGGVEALPLGDPADPISQIAMILAPILRNYTGSIAARAPVSPMRRSFLGGQRGSTGGLPEELPQPGEVGGPGQYNPQARTLVVDPEGIRTYRFPMQPLTEEDKAFFQTPRAVQVYKLEKEARESMLALEQFLKAEGKRLPKSYVKMLEGHENFMQQMEQYMSEQAPAITTNKNSLDELKSITERLPGTRRSMQIDPLTERQPKGINTSIPRPPNPADEELPF